MNSGFNAPYKPSWVDRYFDWIERQPFPTWLFYLFLLLFTTVLANLPFWLEGLQPAFTFTLVAWVAGLWLPVQQGATHLLDKSAKSALESFRPAMKVEEAEFEDLLFEM